MPLDGFAQARLALCGLVAAICLLAVAAHEHPLPSPPSRTVHQSPDRADALRWIEQLRDRQSPRLAPRHMIDLLHRWDWTLVASALPFVTEQYPAHRSHIEEALVARALGEYRHAAAQFDIPPRETTRDTLIQSIISSQIPLSSETRRTQFLELVSVAPDGRIRARALQALAQAPPPSHDWIRIVQRALSDPAESVRLAALDVVARNPWPDAVVAVQSMASSPRPALRSRAARLLEQLGLPADTVEYSEAVRDATRQLADVLGAAGLDPADLVDGGRSSPQGDTAMDQSAWRESFRRQAELVLDRSLSGDADSGDGAGVLWLAIASRLGEFKIALRLWEHEITRFDSDQELRNSGLETLARIRLIGGLDAYRHGQRTLALEQLAAVARVTIGAPPTPSLRAYSSRAADLSAAIWKATTAIESERRPWQPRPETDATATLAVQILNRLDLDKPDHRAEAHRRLDAWCGVQPELAEPRVAARNPMAN